MNQVPPLAQLAERPLFDVDERAYTLGDAVLAALLHGDWDDLERRAREGLACLHALTASGEELPTGETREAATRFRYERDLLAAEELHAWLAHWGLTSGEWREHLMREVLRARFAPELAQVTARYPVADDELEAAVGPEAICSGFLESAARLLAADAALAVGAEPVEAPQQPEAAVVDRATRLLGIPHERAAARLRALASTLDAARRSPARAPREEAIEREVAARALDWTAVELELLEVADEEAAREAALCVRADGQALEEVAAAAGVETKPLRILLGEAEQGLGAKLLSAQEGELIGPLPWNDGSALLLVRAKVRPTADDEETRRRAEALVVARSTDGEVRNRVRWHEHATRLVSPPNSRGSPGI